MPERALRINIFMQKGREENECKKQKMFSKNSCVAETEAEP